MASIIPLFPERSLELPKVQETGILLILSLKIRDYDIIKNSPFALKSLHKGSTHMRVKGSKQKKDMKKLSYISTHL